MGANNSAPGARMSNSEEDSDSPASAVRQSGARLNGEDLPAIVEYLLRSGQFHFISQSEGESDSESGDNSDEGGELENMSSHQATVDSKSEAGTIKSNDISTSVLQSSGRLNKQRWLNYTRPTVPGMVYASQLGMNSRQQFTAGDMSILNSRFLPNYMERKATYGHKAFCGKFSENGNVYMTACQDQCIRVYNTESDKMDQVKRIRARDVGWSVLDVAFSPDGTYAAYSSWSDCIHLCSIQEDIEVHESLPIDPGEHSFAIFSLMFSSDNQEILGGANDCCIYVYDRDANKRSLRIQAHDDDVNTVRFADASSQILYSGGDDGLCKVWDRRMLREERPAPVGVMAGHCNGITFIDSKEDGRYFISNSKDQSMKLWDVRVFSNSSGIMDAKRIVSQQHWDYRWGPPPKKSKKRVRGDSSVMTYRGHCVRQTLIRCKFSPAHSTGQRYLYTGCSTGNILIYDLLSGQIVKTLQGHNSCVRDVDWHPYKNLIMSTSWDYSVGQWTHLDPHAQSAEPDEVVFEVPKPSIRERNRRGSFRSEQIKRSKMQQEYERCRKLFD